MFEGAQFNVIVFVLTTVAIVIAAIGAYAGWRALFSPKKQLIITFDEPARLVHTAGDNLDLKVTLDNHQLSEPYFTAISINSTGRHDVRSDDFDDKRPIAIESTGLIMLVRAPYRFAYISPEHEDIRIHIGPELFKRNQIHTFWVLTDGEPNFELADDFMADVDIRTENSVKKEVSRKMMAAGFTLGSLQLATLITLVVILI